MSKENINDMMLKTIEMAVDEVREKVPAELQETNIIVRLTRKDLRMLGAIELFPQVLRNMFCVEVTYTRNKDEKTNVEYKSPKSVFRQENGVEIIAYERYRKEFDLGVTEEKSRKS